MSAASAQGVVVWFTGLPSSGKSRLAARVYDALRERGQAAVLLDGDEVRGWLVPAPGYDAAGRDAFYETLARMAAALARQGPVVLVAATAHRAAYRAVARVLAPRFVEVFVDVPAAECAERDPKGLWAAARRGELADLPGLDAGYERPAHPDVVARGGLDEAARAAVLAAITPA